MKHTKNDISPPAAKTLEVLEYFSFSLGERSLKEIADATEISQATLLRILNTFLDYGYISKSNEKKYIANFKLTKAKSIPENLDNALNETLERLVEKTGQSAEIITVKGDNLFWYNKKEAVDIQIKINAKTGFKRSIYELDAPSRLYLKFIGEKQAGKCFKKNSFYDINYNKCNWKQAAAIWNAENTDKVTYDKHGNSNGVRRYAVLLKNKAGDFQFILSVAEAAVPRNNTKEHIRQIISAIETERKILKGAIE